MNQRTIPGILAGSDIGDNSLPSEYLISGYSHYWAAAAALRNIKVRLELAKTSESEKHPLILLD